MWRYQALLPLEDPILYPLAVGGTPLIASPRLREFTGLASLWLKDETRSPTGSNKDRATALILEQALHMGVGVVSCASTGNVAVSLALGAAASNIEAVIFVPVTVADIKLQLMLFAGATVFKVREGYEAAVRLSRAAAQAFGWYDRNTGYNPLTLEAKKTVALEIWEQLGRQIPDIVVVPVGDGVTLNGIAKGFRELLLCGVTTKVPRILGVQAEHCQPVKSLWESYQRIGVQARVGMGMAATLPSPYGSTVADGIAVAAPSNMAMTLRDVHDCGGDFIAISDEVILHTVHLLASKAGILAEPAGAAALAGARQALTQGLIHKQDTVVVLVTGSGLKTPHYLQPSTLHGAYEVSAHLDDVKQIYERLQRDGRA